MVAALGLVVRAGTSMDISSVERTMQANRQPALISSAEKARKSNFDGSISPVVTLILHFLQVPYPPHVESMAIPFQDAASNALTPVGTVITFSLATELSFSSARKESFTRPVPSCSGSAELSKSRLLILGLRYRCCFGCFDCAVPRDPVATPRVQSQE